MFAWFILPPFAFTANFALPKPLHGLRLFGVCVLTGYVLLVATAKCGDWYLTGEDLANDTGRANAILTGLPLSAVWVGVWFALLYAGKSILLAMMSASTASVPPNPTEREPTRSRNPYEPPLES